MSTPLSITDAITILRQRYPEALICVECAKLIATRRASYAKSNLSEVARLSFVCAECRFDAAEAERLDAIRRHNAERLNAGRKVAASSPTGPADQAELGAPTTRAAPPQRHQKPLSAPIPDSREISVEPSRKLAISYGQNEGVLMTVQLDRRVGRFFRTGRRGGRPRSPLTTQERQRAASRRYRTKGPSHAL